MQIEVRLFAALREQVGEQQLRLTLAAPMTVADFIAGLADQHPPLATAVAAMPRRMVAINEQLARETDLLADGDVLALFPPVTGG